MTMRNTGLTKAFIAATAIPRYSVVKLDAADDAVAVATAKTDRLVGVLADAAEVPAGKRADVILEGIAEVRAGATVNKGADVTVDTQGRVVAASSTDEVVGWATEAANAAGDIISIKLTV